MHDEDEDAPEPIHGVFTALGRAEMVPPRWIIKDLIPVGLSFITAPPKSQKSTFEMAVACLIAGYKCNALPPGMDSADVKGRVLGISYEATAGDLRHMAEVGLGVAIPDDDSILIADNPWLFQLDDEGGVARLLSWLTQLRPRLAFIDPFADAHSLEEKDSGPMIRLLRPLREWAVKNDAAMVMVHHTRKRMAGDAGMNTSADVRGSSAIYGKLDGLLVFTPKDEKGLIHINATFKRGASWSREIQFNSYGGKGLRATEVIGDVEKMVLGLLKHGHLKYSDIAAQLHVGKKRVVESVETLVRCGRVARIENKLVVTKKPKREKP